MKIKFTFAFIVCIIQASIAQKISSFSIAFQSEGNLMTVDGFGEINNVLKKNNTFTIQNAFVSRGISLKFTNRAGSGGTELSYLNVFSNAYDSTALTTNIGKAPRISGFNFKILFFRKYFQSARWYADGALGFSVNSLTFKLVDRQVQPYSLDSLIANPILSSSLDFRQSRPGLSLDISSGIYYKTKWFKRAFDDFDIGAKFGYSQPLVNGQQWIVNGTSNNYLLQDIPKVRLNNFYFQLSFLFKYNLIVAKRD
jgi:hypothetical protein